MFYKTDTHEFEEWLASKYLAIAGAEGEDDDVPVDDGDEVNENNASGEGANPPQGSGDQDEGDKQGDPPDADLDEIERIRHERDEARQALARAQAAAQREKAEARRAREEAAKKNGNWEQVARERATELEESNERAQRAEQRALTAEETLDRERREVRITRLANKLGFRNTDDALVHLQGKPELTGDDKSCQRALQNLAKERPYLIDERRSFGRTMHGQNGEVGLLTKEQMDRMNPAEIMQAKASGLLDRSLQALRPGGGPVQVG